MMYNDKELREIQNTKKMLCNYYAKLIKEVIKNSSVNKLNQIMSDAQYTTNHYNNILNRDIYDVHRRAIKVTGNSHWYSDFQNVEMTYEFNWNEDFLQNAYDYGINDGIITKSKALKDMHSWCNPYGGEWEYASDNYPHIRIDLPEEIKKVNQNPHYWLETVGKSDNDYRVKNLDYHMVLDFLGGMLSLFKDKETVNDANF